jgi:hypothetical protein
VYPEGKARLCAGLSYAILGAATRLGSLAAPDPLTVAG